jgi:hypothetical protein
MEQPAAPAGSPGRSWRGRPPRDVLLLLAGAAALLIVFWLVLRLRSLLAMLLISFFLSFALEPPVNRLAGLGWRRGLGTAAVFAAIVVAVVGFVAVLGSLLVAQVGALVDGIPGYAQQMTDFLNDRFGTSLSGGELAEQLRGNQGVRDFVNGLAVGAVGLSTTLVGLVLQGFTIGLFTADQRPDHGRAPGGGLRGGDRRRGGHGADWRAAGPAGRGQRAGPGVDLSPPLRGHRRPTDQDAVPGEEAP